MVEFSSPFGSDEGLFDDYDAFVPAHLPEPGGFLEGHSVLTGDDHVAFHRHTRECFEERGVYDMTFDYNLARLNLDSRHPSAGYRYAVETDDAAVLRAEFTPTTPFCPQADTLTVGSVRAWNGLADRHEYDLVRVRIAPDAHHGADEINERLAAMERRNLETGDVSGESDQSASGDSDPMDRTMTSGESGRESQNAPF